MDLIENQDMFEKQCKRFYMQAAEPYSEYPGMEVMHLCYRLLWLGEWLRETNNWVHIHPKEALTFALIKQHRWKPQDVEALTPKEMSLALTDYWASFHSDLKWKDRYRITEKQLDVLDDPFRGMNAWCEPSPECLVS
ncbi:hypothetical protein [Chania multitudinisentens]|uniref:hypothetical protein n=1 Tax=Chania multitudinisentens TaxID=1639108 RepID=UPI0003E1505C|nr:hypothetical protein [Chania multitudinisentens]